MQNGFIVELSVVNTSAAGLNVQGELRNGNENVQTSGTIVEYVPLHSDRHGRLFFISDSQQYELQLRAKD